MSEPAPSIFRARALEVHQQGESPGRPLEVVSSWTRWAVRVTVLVVAVGLGFAALAPVGEYAQGPAVVRREGRTIVTSSASGTVRSVARRPGQRVEAGELLVRLDDAGAEAALARVEHEYEQRLVELLRAPEDEARRERLTSLGAELELARARLDERSVRAPSAGLISDLRVREGQRVDPGDALVAIEGEAAQTVVVGLLPGHYRPLLSAEASELVLELEGFPDSRVEVDVREVADEVVGPAEALRVLGRDREGAMQLDGPVVVVEARLASERFASDDVDYRIYDGMQGRLEAKVRAATLLEILIPALRRL